jgi:hypothetical protein
MDFLDYKNSIHHYIQFIMDAEEDHYLLEVGVVLAADNQSASSSGYQASLWDP